MKEISIENFKRKYPEEYGELLKRLEIPHFKDAVLNVAGVKAVKVFSMMGRRYYCSLVDRGSTRIDRKEFLRDWGEGKPYECYMLTIARCDADLDGYEPKYTTSLTGGECVEYLLRIKERKAYYTVYIADDNVLSKNLARIFLHAVGTQIDIDVIHISVHVEDTALLTILHAAGFTIEEEEDRHRNAVKSLL